jgi:hypothetical protein
MSYTMVTYTVKPGREEENARLVRSVFDELAEARPAGFRYAVFQLPDTREFVHIYADEGSPTGVRALASFQAFLAEAPERHEQPPAVTTPALIGEYRAFDAPEGPASADGSAHDAAYTPDDDGRV